jgi:hypothetical protein
MTRKLVSAHNTVDLRHIWQNLSEKFKFVFYTGNNKMYLSRILLFFLWNSYLICFA